MIGCVDRRLVTLFFYHDIGAHVSWRTQKSASDLLPRFARRGSGCTKRTVEEATAVSCYLELGHVPARILS
jgi:hypothetical protein